MKKRGPGARNKQFIEKCQQLATDKETLQFLQDVIRGKDVDYRFNSAGEIVKCPPSVAERVRCWEKLCDRGFGRAIQPMGFEGTENSEVKISITSFSKKKSEA